MSSLRTRYCHGLLQVRESRLGNSYVRLWRCDPVARDFLHAEPFDEATLTKLELFQLYTREWLPVFTAPEKPWWKEINIFDFFAGPGLDTKGVIGSPLRTLTELTSGDHLSRIREKGLRVKVWFSDKSYKNTKADRDNLSVWLCTARCRSELRSGDI